MRELLARRAEVERLTTQLAVTIRERDRLRRERSAADHEPPTDDEPDEGVDVE